jgi:transcriptional regulator with XRE-family HTH domain
MIACAGPYTSFGACLQDRRQMRGWTISKLSHLTGISRQTIYRYESDERTPNAIYRNALRLALGLSKTDDHGWWSSEW